MGRMAFATAPSAKSPTCSSLPELAGQAAARLEVPVFPTWLAAPAPAEKNLLISIVFLVTRGMVCAIFQMCPCLLELGSGDTSTLTVFPTRRTLAVHALALP